MYLCYKVQFVSYRLDMLILVDIDSYYSNKFENVLVHLRYMFDYNSTTNSNQTSSVDFHLTYNIEDYNHEFLLIHLYNSAVRIDKISNVFDFQDRMISNNESIWTMATVYMYQNRVEFDMNVVQFEVYINVTQEINVMAIVGEFENLVELYLYNYLDMDSMVTRRDRHIYLRNVVFFVIGVKV